MGSERVPGPGSARAVRTWRRLGAIVAAVLSVASLTTGTLVANASTPAVAATPPASSGLLPTGWLHTSGSRIVAENGAVVQVRAVNWFGLETANCAPHGLWSVSMGSALDQVRSFGFNALRVPYANECLDAGATANSIDYAKNPGLVGKKPVAVLDALVAESGKRGLKVILDRHRPDYGSQSELWYTSRYSEARWIADWQMLARRYAANPTVIGADLHNEPHGPACWGCPDRARDWAAAATRAGNATLAANPRWLILVEGVERSADGATNWWGGNLREVAFRPITLAVPNRLVYSPHDYPRTVYPQPWFSAGNYPANLPGVWDRNWGFLARTGRAPVLLGEFGTKYTDASDRAWLGSLVAYLKATGISYAFWSYNPNSGDTGGLVKDDWRTPEPAKLAALKSILGAAPVPVPSTSAPAPGTPAPAPGRPAPAAPAPAAPAPVPSAPAPPSPAPAPSTTTGSLSVGWQLQSAWQGGYVAQLTLSSSAPRTGWRISWPDRAATGVVNAWGMTCAPGAGVLTCTGTDWARTITPGQPQHVGLQVATNGAAPGRPVLTLG